SPFKGQFVAERNLYPYLAGQHFSAAQIDPQAVTVLCPRFYLTIHVAQGAVALQGDHSQAAPTSIAGASVDRCPRASLPGVNGPVQHDAARLRIRRHERTERVGGTIAQVRKHQDAVEAKARKHEIGS